MILVGFAGAGLVAGALTRGRAQFEDALSATGAWLTGLAILISIRLRAPHAI
jgi:hypothetical protein